MIFIPNRVTITEASKITGLTEYTLRQGVKQGRFPHMRTSGSKGKILIDIDLLNKYLEQEAVENMRGNQEPPREIVYGRLRGVGS